MQEIFDSWGWLALSLTQAFGFRKSLSSYSKFTMVGLFLLVRSVSKTAIVAKLGTNLWWDPTVWNNRLGGHQIQEKTVLAVSKCAATKHCLPQQSPQIVPDQHKQIK